MVESTFSIFGILISSFIGTTGLVIVGAIGAMAPTGAQKFWYEKCYKTQKCAFYGELEVFESWHPQGFWVS